jgi:predicted permease
MDHLRQDITYALRKLWSAPGFAVTAILTLALGVGANTAIFSVVHGVLLRPLPFPRPEQLHQVWSSNPSTGMLEGSVSPLDLEDWRAQRRVIADIGGYWYASNGSGVDLTGLGPPQRLSATFVEPGFFGALGVLPAIGRLPREDEMVRGGRDRVLVLSHAFWQRQFAGDPAVVGTTLTIGGEPYEVLGVMPRGFLYPAGDVEVWVPYSTIPDSAIPRQRWMRLLTVVARAREGVTEAQLRAELQTVVSRLAQAHPQDNANWTGVATRPLREAITGNVRLGLLVLMGAVGFVLLLTCVNVASLLLARATAREREMAVRVALGAGRGRVVRQLLTESVVLALLAGVAGLAVAWGGVRLLLALAAGQLPRGTEVAIDGATLAYALGVALVTGFVFGLVPAVRSTTGDLQQALRAAGRGLAGSAGNRLRYGLVISEVALSMMLVVGGGLMVRSFLALLRVDPGFRPEQLLVLNFTLDADRHPNYRAVYAEMLARVRALPGVVAAGGVKDAPLKGTGERWSFTLPGTTIPEGQEPPAVQVLHVSDGWFHAVGARLLAGRDFSMADRDSAPPVTIVNEAFARRWFPGADAVGKRLQLGPSAVEIVGVVNDIRQRAVAEPAEPMFYVHVQQNGRVRVNLMVRTGGDPIAMVSAVRNAIWSVERDQTITEAYTYQEAMREALARPRLLTVLLGIFGAIGLALGALGLYGVLAFLVSQRTREIGVRLALGARPGDVLRMIVSRGLGLTGVGIAIGASMALVLGRLMAGLLYGVEPNDPGTMLLVSGVLLSAAALASWIPARRAARVDPAVTLREE